MLHRGSSRINHFASDAFTRFTSCEVNRADGMDAAWLIRDEPRCNMIESLNLLSFILFIF